MDNPVRISVIVPHYQGDVLSGCLASIYQTTGEVELEVILVDDGIANDGSVMRAIRRFPGTRLVKTSGGMGYGAACNAGFRASTGEFVLFLNNDAEVADGWLPPLLGAARAHPAAGFFQPKLLSADRSELFPWGGGCGGGIDWLGYPYMRGSFIFKREYDRGQYDDAAEVFWANGAALFARRSALERVGPFDEDFYMQMEDVDLGWRAHLAGIGVRTVPKSVVRHHGGWTLPGGSLQRYYLSHRNSAVLLMKNAGALRAAVLVPARLAIEFVGAISAWAVFGNWRLMLGSLGGLLWLAVHAPNVVARRRAAQRRRVVADRRIFSRIHRGSILFSYLFRGIRTATELAETAESRGPLPELAKQPLRAPETLEVR